MCAWQTDEDAAALERLGRGKAQDLCLLEVLLLFHFDLLYFTLDICTIKNDALGSMTCITICEHHLIAVVSPLSHDQRACRSAHSRKNAKVFDY